MLKQGGAGGRDTAAAAVARAALILHKAMPGKGAGRIGGPGRVGAGGGAGQCGLHASLGGRVSPRPAGGGGGGGGGGGMDGVMGGAAAAGAGSRDLPAAPAAPAAPVEPAVPMGSEWPEGSDVRALTSVSSIAPTKQLSGAVRERPGGGAVASSTALTEQLLDKPLASKQQQNGQDQGQGQDQDQDQDQDQGQGQGQGQGHGAPRTCRYRSITCPR